MNGPRAICATPMPHAQSAALPIAAGSVTRALYRGDGRAHRLGLSLAPRLLASCGPTNDEADVTGDAVARKGKRSV